MIDSLESKVRAAVEGALPNSGWTSEPVRWRPAVTDAMLALVGEILRPLALVYVELSLNSDGTPCNMILEARGNDSAGKLAELTAFARTFVRAVHVKSKEKP